ncbi:hypothetical protein [Pseudomonas yamanorum]|uniref:Uncharacterized protein n=1 Tax=Pseudomonas yamanorum TaxID=515393 RepID=A0A7Y8K695_9PSED|nr:hypothetical protein [Pseudomonas yamanorum]
MKDTRQLVSNLKKLMLESNDWVSNYPLLPILIYERAITYSGYDPAALFEKTFSTHGWPSQWRDASTTTITTSPKDMKY